MAFRSAPPPMPPPPPPPPPPVDAYADDMTDYSDDDYTLPGYDDDDDAYSISNSSMTSIRSYDNVIPRRSYRVPKEAGPAKPVYEAWVIYRCPDTKEILSGTRLFGVDCAKVWDYHYGGVNVGAREEFNQNELAEMHLAAIDSYHESHKSCLPLRKRKTYEQDLDARVKKAPQDVQRELNRLLGDREAATATPWSNRDWTVVYVREQLRRKFAHTEPEVVKRHRFRKWKNNDRGQPTEFFCIIRGATTKISQDPMGFPAIYQHGNPWKHVDEEELAERVRELNRRHREKKGYYPPPPPPPPMRRRPPPPVTPRYRNAFTPVRPHVNVMPPAPSPPAPSSGYPPYIPYTARAGPSFRAGPPPPPPPPPPPGAYFTTHFPPPPPPPPRMPGAAAFAPSPLFSCEPQVPLPPRPFDPFHVDYWSNDARAFPNNVFYEPPAFPKPSSSYPAAHPMEPFCMQSDNPFTPFAQQLPQQFSLFDYPPPPPPETPLHVVPPTEACFHSPSPPPVSELSCADEPRKDEDEDEDEQPKPINTRT